MLGVDHHHHIQKMCLFLRVACVRADHPQKVFRRRELYARVVDVKRLAVKIVAVHCVGVCNDRRERADELDGLREQVLRRNIVGIFVVGVEQQHASGKVIHNVPARMAHDHPLCEALGQLSGPAHDIVKIGKLGFCRQVPHEQQIRDLLVAKCAALAVRFDDLVEVNAAIVELTGDRNAAAVFDQIALHAADLRHADEHARAVAVAKAALNLAKVIAVRDLIFFFYKTAEGSRFFAAQIHFTFHSVLLL